MAQVEVVGGMKGGPDLRQSKDIYQLSGGGRGNFPLSFGNKNISYSLALASVSVAIFIVLYTGFS